MDAFAVAICQGLSMTRIKWGHALTVGLYFGGFQALMPLLGWVLGSQFSGYIQQYDHWVAFILLLLIGGNMIREAPVSYTHLVATGALPLLRFL